MKHIFKKENIPFFLALSICCAFFAAYTTLSIIRHDHFWSLGFDLGINSQVVWRYSNFELPISTIHPYPGESKLVTHVELVYAILAPFYWIWDATRMLLIVDAFFMCASAIPVFLLAQKRKLSASVCVALTFSYLMFYGIQNAMWFDVHSASFAAGFIMWFFYFLDSKKYKVSWIFLLLAITAKENIGLITLLICLVYFVLQKQRQVLWMAFFSFLYLLYIYFVYFPIIINKPYLYQNHGGLLANLNPLSLFDTQEKREALFYSFASFGFLPLFMPILIIPIIGDFATYFVLASELEASHGIFMHYRVTLAPLLAWAAILAIAKYKKLNNTYIAIYLILSTLTIQYVLHLPLSYLTKSWFWTKPSGVENIVSLRWTLKQSDAVVAQNNIVPHISRRDQVYTLYPEKKKFMSNSPCGQPVCDWFRWAGKPKYLFVDTSPEWDARHFLTNREEYVKGLKNIEKAGVVKKKSQKGTAVIYEVLKQP